MSPRTLRRYRADRLLRTEFERLRASVLAVVSARLRTAGVRLDATDLDECYAQAWQGLYANVLDGREILSAEAWLVRVTYRRAIDEHRARGRLKRLVPSVERAGAGHRGAPAGVAPAEQRDLADRLDERARLRHVFEALRSRLSERERQAATLCYLQGLSRAEAAERMGVSERRMHKLMDGRGDGAPGVAQKVGAFVETIGDGRWCEEQGSLMRGFAYGILDPAGERHRLAEAHSSRCPACRAYVRSLRGLAVVLPPSPSLLHLLLGSGALAGAGAAAGPGAASGVATGSGAANGPGLPGGAVTAAGAGASPAASAGAVSASGAAGGGWWLAGPLGAKLAAGCVLALGVGAGCVALGGAPGQSGRPAHARHDRATAAARRPRDVQPSGAEAVAALLPATNGTTTVRAQAAHASGVAPTQQAVREFGPEQPAAVGAGAAASGPGAPTTAHAASLASTAGPSSSPSVGGGSSAGAGAGHAGATVPAAQREFAPG